jgi:glycosyltransferase involved in cell wall biosynthesis
MYKLAILNTHPIQYLAPLYRRIAREPDIQLTVYFCSQQGAEEYNDAGFGQRIRWDTPLLEGYEHKFLKELWGRERVGGFWSLVNFGILGELRKNRYDALLVNGHRQATTLMAIFAAKALGTPVFMRCETHLGLPQSRLKRFARKWLMTFLYTRLCSACLPIGSRNKQFYLAHGVKEENLFSVPYAVDNDFFASSFASLEQRTSLRAALQLPTEKPVVLFVSKLMSRKRPMDLLAAFHNVRKAGIDAALAFVGSGEQRTDLEKYVSQHHVPDVHFFGFRNQSELPQFYSAADVFVLPAENEPWGMVVNEVMCAGLPVIASNEIGAVADLVRHGENGFTYKAGDVDTLTEYLSQVLRDPGKRTRMGEASRRIIARWDYERCVLGIKQAVVQTGRRPSRVVESQVE